MNISKIPLLSVKNKKLRLQCAQAQHITTCKKQRYAEEHFCIKNKSNLEEDELQQQKTTLKTPLHYILHEGVGAGCDNPDQKGQMNENENKLCMNVLVM